MHKVFDDLGINSPKTLITSLVEFNDGDFPFPFLLKEIHSCESKGLHKIECIEDLKTFKDSLDSHNLTDVFLIQEILNIRRDLRVIVVGDKIVHYYWRINLSDHWRPTATSKGNIINFSNFPIIHNEIILNYVKKLKLSAAAFDIAWQNDNVNSDPIILEVSPAFSPNPLVTREFDLLNYGLYKKKVSIKGYDYNYVHLIFKIREEHLSYLNY